MATVVTISASYGAGGSVVGPRVADVLGVPFVDRALPAAVARELRVPLAEALAHDERREHGLGRLFAAFARTPYAVLGATDTLPPAIPIATEEEFVAETERVIRALAEGGGGAVVLGRAAASVLGDRPGCLHVRLGGPVARRVEQVVRLEGIEVEEARRVQVEVDAARRAYVRHFYRRDPEDPSLYHLGIDSTRVPLGVVVDLVVSAARAVCPG